MSNTYPVTSWETPATHYPRTRLGSAQIKTHYYSRGLYHAYMTGPELHLGGPAYEYWRAKRRLPITNLLIAGEVWMVDDAPHWWAMLEHASKYSGRVLVAGLGLGLIVHALQANPAVSEVVVVERNRDVIDLVGPLVPRDKLRIVNADWYEWEPDFAPDGVFYDLFVGPGVEFQALGLREMLHQKERWPGAKVFRIHGLSNDYLNRLTDTIIASNRMRYSAALRTVGAHRQYPYRAEMSGQTREFAVESIIKGDAGRPVPDDAVALLLGKALRNKHGMARSDALQVRVVLRPVS